MRHRMLAGKAVHTLPVLLALSAFLMLKDAAAQQAGGFNPNGMADKAMGEPFVGVTTDGQVRPGLFSLKDTGISVQALVEAATAFLTSFDEDRRTALQHPLSSPAWRNWANIHRFPREGVSFAEMTAAQREAANQLLRTSLSAKGYRTTRDIMRLNHHLAELISNFDDYGEDLYWMVVFGEPGSSEPWGWQIEGHHLIINYLVAGDQIVMTPTFMGSEPVQALSGKYEGTAVLQPEQSAGLAFAQSLDAEQLAKAVLGPKRGRSENRAEMFKDNIQLPYAGLAGAELTHDQRSALLELVGLYVGNIRHEHAEVRMEEVAAHLDETYFVWIGDLTHEAVFYYRIQSPVILIEFDHQGPIALGGSRGTPTRRHIHTVVRTPNGNDYGKDLLRQHYETSGHH